MVGEVREGDEVIVNVEALDLELGSGGLRRRPRQPHPRARRAAARRRPPRDQAQLHARSSIRSSPSRSRTTRRRPRGRGAARMPVLVLSLHGQLAPAAWAAARAAPGLRVGYVQTPGGALPGRLSRDVADLRQRDLLCGHITAGPAYGGEAEAISVAGALHAAAELAGLGRRDRRPGARDPGLGERPGPRRHGRARQRPRRAGAGAADAAGAAAVRGRPASAPPRAQPPLRGRAADAAGPGARPGARGRRVETGRPATRRGRSGRDRARSPAQGVRGPPRHLGARGRARGVRRERAAGDDDGPRAGRGSALLRRGARRRRRAGRAGQARFGS